MVRKTAETVGDNVIHRCMLRVSVEQTASVECQSEAIILRSHSNIPVTVSNEQIIVELSMTVTDNRRFANHILNNAVEAVFNIVVVAYTV